MFQRKVELFNRVGKKQQHGTKLAMSASLPPTGTAAASASPFPHSVS
jgi:hypothetical protein